MIPVARTEKLLIQQIGEELIVYDQINNTSHCLNPMAARVWELCNGQHPVKDIAELLEKELYVSEDVDMRGLVWLALEELERYHLIKEYLRQPTTVLGISRRTVLKTGAVVGGFALGSAFPFVKSIAVALPGNAVSTGNPTKPTPPPPPSCKGKCYVDPTTPFSGVCTNSADRPCGGDCECQATKNSTGLVVACKCVKKKN